MTIWTDRNKPDFLNAQRGQKDLSLILVVFAVLFLPFINKAFHIDDVAFLNLSRMIDWNPLVAIPQDYFYQGRVLPQLLPYEITHPPLIPYLLKIGISIFGENETPLHLIFLVFPALSLYFLDRLSREFTLEATAGRLSLLILFCSMPAFLVNAQNLMTDVATLCFLLGGISFFLRVRRTQAIAHYCLAGLFLTLSIFCSYQALAFLPILAIYTFADRGTKRYRLATLLVPIILMGTWLLLIYSHYGIFPLLASKTDANISSEISHGLGLAAFQGKTIYLLATTGLMTFFPLVFNLLAKQRKKMIGAVFTVLCCIFFASLIGLDQYSEQERICLAFLMASGTLSLSLSLLSAVRDIARPTDRAISLFFISWIAVVVAYNILIMPFGAARYLLPLLPPLYLLLLKPSTQKVRQGRFLTTMLLIGSILFGFLTALSDYRYANSYRTMAAEVARYKNNSAKDINFWYVGEWGMRIYLDRIGAKYLLADSTEPAPGDYIIIPDMPKFWIPAPQVQIRTKRDGMREFSSSLPLRLFNRRSNAGFYSHLWGLLPMAISKEPDEVFIMMKVVR